MRNPGFFFGSTPLSRVAALDNTSDRTVVYADWTVAATVGNGVPEPGSLALLGLGVAALGWLRRKAVRTAKAINSEAIDA